jgi:predicted HTH domain antitoxin
VSLDLPEELSAALGFPDRDLPRAALEAIALEAYRECKLSTAQLRRLLGFETLLEVDEFLKQHGVELEYTTEDLERDREVHRRLGL